MTAHLKLVDTNGEVHEDDDPQAIIRGLQAALSRAEKTIQGMRAKAAADRANYARKAEVEAVFEKWRWALKKPRCQLTDDRFDAIKAMLEKGYSAEHFDLMIAGLLACPHVVYGKRRPTGSKDSLETDIAYVLEKGRRFEELVNLGHEAKKAPC